MHPRPSLRRTSPRTGRTTPSATTSPSPMIPLARSPGGVAARDSRPPARRSRTADPTARACATRCPSIAGRTAAGRRPRRSRARARGRSAARSRSPPYTEPTGGSRAPRRIATISMEDGGEQQRNVETEPPPDGQPGGAHLLAFLAHLAAHRAPGRHVERDRGDRQPHARRDDRGRREWQSTTQNSGSVPRMTAAEAGPARHRRSSRRPRSRPPS